MKNLVVFTGAGMSAESGISTFRDSGGLWEKYPIEEVATPAAWFKNPGLVMRFYNERRKQVIDAVPNQGHFALVELEQKYMVTIITQNVDDLHERAGSSNVLHLHGEIRKARSTGNPEHVVPIATTDLKLGDKCPEGHQLRPHIVWFGEEVPMMQKACEIAEQADIFVIIGSSLNVYPAAGLVNYTLRGCKRYLIDPKSVPVHGISNLEIIRATAAEGVPKLVENLMSVTA